MKAQFVLAVSCYYHDSAAVLLQNGEIIGAVQEERFTRKKQDDAFPLRSIAWLLKNFEVEPSQIEACVYYEKPFVTFERLIETHLNHAPWGYKNFMRSMPVWIKEKFFLEREIKKNLKSLGLKNVPVKYSEHHLSHAASAFFPSPFKDATVLCVDGVGEWATTSVWLGENQHLKCGSEIHFPHSLGLLYSAVTGYLGFKVNSGEYKVMGLAPYGKPVFKELMLKHLISLHDDGSYSLNMKYFGYEHSSKMFNHNMEELFGRKGRLPETDLEDFHMNIAASIQLVLEEAMLHLVKKMRLNYPSENLCLAGGVALNCVANSRLLKESGYKNIWIQPAAGDAGGALGAALAYWHLGKNKSRIPVSSDGMKGSLLGPSFTSEEIQSFLQENKVPFVRLKNEDLWQVVSSHIEEGQIIGWFQGRMEYGPRALGNRSILGDARRPNLQKTMNLKIKFRESFRPFAPVILQDEVGEIFDWKGSSPYMLFTAPIKNKHLLPLSRDCENKFGMEKLNMLRSKYPAITHIDNSARLQTVHEELNPELHGLMSVFKQRNSTSVLVNTSFNVRGEPIVCTPQDAYQCFRRTDIDVLVLGEFVVTKANLPHYDNSEWRNEFELD